MKRVFLTGASSGIGFATAQALHARGHEVWGTSRDPTTIPEMQRMHPVQLDLVRLSSIDEAFSTALAQAGHFDVLVNNAGSGHFGPAEFLSDQAITEQFHILFFGHVHLMQLALRAMHERGSGLIINVTSLASRLPVPFMAAYNAAKAAMAAFTMSIQLELGESAVRIVDLQPADICTGFNDAVIRIDKQDARYDAKIQKTWDAVERNMKAAPQAGLVAQHVLKLIEAVDPPPRVTVGDVFQSTIAPLIFRFLPQRLRIWGLKKYYGI